MTDIIAGIVAGVLVALAVIAVIAVVAAAGAAITLLAWNLGVVAIVAACGGHVAKIGLVTALFANIALGCVGRIFRRAPAVNTSS